MKRKAARDKAGYMGPGRGYQSRKYQKLRNQRISRSLRAHHVAKRQNDAWWYDNWVATLAIHGSIVATCIFLAALL